MDTNQKVENLKKTGKLYQDQGLYVEARRAYESALELINESNQIPEMDGLVSEINNKIEELTSAAEHVETAPETHELSDDVQDLIKNLFSFSEKKDPDTRALTEAVTLAKFGQTERAVEELSRLLERPPVRAVAAKNILRCHMLASNHETALSTFENWNRENIFPPDELDGIRSLLELQLVKKGIQKPLPKVTLVEPNIETTATQDGKKPKEILDIGSVLINFDQGPLKGKPIEFDVNFQTGNTVSLLIESKEKKLLDTLSIGFKLREVQFRSSVAIFRGAGVVSAKVMIHEGPQKGDYHMDIKVQDD